MQHGATVKTSMQEYNYQRTSNTKAK